MGALAPFVLTTSSAARNHQSGVFLEDEAKPARWAVIRRDVIAVVDNSVKGRIPVMQDQPQSADSPFGGNPQQIPAAFLLRSNHG
jgi:hypothetical protein